MYDIEYLRDVLMSKKKIFWLVWCHYFFVTIFMLLYLGVKTVHLQNSNEKLFWRLTHKGKNQPGYVRHGLHEDLLMYDINN